MSTRCLIFPTCGDDEKEKRLLEKLRVVREELTVDVKEAFGCSHFSSSPFFIPSFARSFFFLRSSLFCHLLHIFIWCRTSPYILTALTRFFSSPTRLYAYWRVLSRLSSGGNYIIRVWAKWLSRVSIGGVNWAWRLTLDGEGCSAGRTWTDVDVGQSKITNQEETFIKNGEKKGGSAQLINTQQLVRPQHDGWRWWRRKRRRKRKKVEMKWVYKWLGLFFSWFLEFDSFVFLVRVSSLRCGTVRAARWQRWWSSRRWWWLFCFLSFLFTFHYNFEWMMWLLRAVVMREVGVMEKKVYLWHFASSKVLKWRAQGRREQEKKDEWTPLPPVTLINVGN